MRNIRRTTSCGQGSERNVRARDRGRRWAATGVVYTLLALLIPAAPGSAWDQFSTGGSTNCVSCHGNFRASSYTSLVDGMNWGNLHNVHRTTMLNSDCSACHLPGDTFPVRLAVSAGGSGLAAIGCMGCHGREEDNTAANPEFPNGRGAGLRQHHFTAGVTSCGNCHADADPANYTTVGENVLPEYYANPGNNHPLMPTDPCNADGSEDFAGASIGLDNDGDDLYDGDDGDCGSTDVPRIREFPALLAQNTPNPFALETAIPYATFGPADVRLDVFTVSGRLVRTLAEHHDAEARTHVVRWDGRDARGQSLASGVYLCRLTVNGSSTSRTMVLRK